VSEARDPYEVLGVPRDATVRQIRSAYVARARRVHPDVVGPRGLALMRELNAAWATLKDAEERTAFDRATSGSATGSSPAMPSRNDPNRPFWTGAMGPPPGRPIGPVLEFGIYLGWSIGEIARRDRGYLLWLRDRPEASAIRGAVMKLIDPDANESEAPRRGRR
jgi:curved DNA-binding protein CbpA